MVSIKMKKNILLKEAPKKILIPRLDTFGDLILLESFLEVLLNKYPEAEIFLLVREEYSQLKALFPPQIKWLTIKFNPYNEFDIDVNEVNNLVKEEPWDLILTTTFNRTSIDNHIASILNNIRNIAIGEGNSPHYEFVPAEENLGELLKYQILWEKLTGEDIKLPLPRLFVAGKFSVQANDILSTLGLDERYFYICAPAGIANIKIKAWPEERYAEVISWIESKYNLRTLLIGHEKEEEKIKKVYALANNRKTKVSVWLGKDGEIPLLAALSQKAKFYLGNDTGPMHIAAAVRTPVVGIFGGGHWPRFLAEGKGYALARKMPCFGCGWDCIFGDAPCVRLITIKDVKQALSSLLLQKNSSLACNIFYASKPYQSICDELIVKAGTRMNNLNTYTHQVRQKDEVIHQKNSLIQSIQEECDKLSKEQNVQIESLSRSVERLKAEIDNLSLEKETEIKSLRVDRDVQIQALSEVLEKLKEERNALRNSLSWKITSPLRLFRNIL
jgi:ADP-heptose:LPS heptosyltransferase